MSLIEWLERNQRVFQKLDVELEELRDLGGRTIDVLHAPVEYIERGDALLTHINTALDDHDQLQAEARQGRSPSALEVGLKVVKHLF